MKAIVTKYHGPTENKGSRYSATDSDGNKVTLSTACDLINESDHDRIALALCNKMKWTGKLVRGSLNSCQYVYTWLESWKTLEIK